LGTAVVPLPLGGAMFWAGPGVAPGTSAGGRTGAGSKKGVWAPAGKAESHRPMANRNRPPPLALVAAILIEGFFDRNRGKFKPAFMFVTNEAVC